MYNNKRILAIIVARAGSKGLPGKNIIDCAGKPLIQWTIEAALQSSIVDKVFVSTDSDKIASVAISSGACVPFLRSKELATDTASVEDVIHEVISKLAETEATFDYILLLQPTSPLRTSKQINQAIEQYFTNLKDSEETLVSVYVAPKKVGWLLRQTNNHYIDFCFDQNKDDLRRQTLSTFYLPNGAIYFAPISHFKKSFYTTKTQFFVMPEECSVDIDTQEDLEKAISLLQKQK